MDELYSRILAQELGKMGGSGSRFVARFLSNVPYESTLDIGHSPADVRVIIVSILDEIGHENRELPELSVICGSGHANLNPTIVSVAVAALGSGSRVSIRAVAKEGLVKQGSAMKAVERVKDLLRKRSS